MQYAIDELSSLIPQHYDYRSAGCLTPERGRAIAGTTTQRRGHLFQWALRFALEVSNQLSTSSLTRCFELSQFSERSWRSWGLMAVFIFGVSPKISSAANLMSRGSRARSSRYGSTSPR